MLAVEALLCGYRPGQPVVGPLSFQVNKGEVVCILGPNGVGKTTLFKTVLGMLKPLGGRILLRGRDTRTYTVKEFARTAAYVPQGHIPPFPYSVRDVVVMGCNPNMNEFSSPRKKDFRTAERMLETMGIAGLADRDYSGLSGGERQLVVLARALTQNAQLLLMDEPTSHLDYGNETRVLSQIRRLSRLGYTIIMITHAPGHAFLCADKVAAIGRDGFFISGRPEDVLTQQTLSRLYGVEVRLAEVELTGPRRHVKVCVPLTE